MDIKRHVFLCGGTGEECGEGIILCRESIALGRGESHQLSIVYETMDEGGGALGRIRKLTEDTFPIPSRDPHTEFGYVEVADKVKLKLQESRRTGDIKLRDVLPEDYEERTLLKNWTLDIILSQGTYGDMKAATLLCDLALQAAEGSDADKNMGFEAVEEEVVNSNRKYQVRVVFIGSAHGGEGRTNLSRHPIILREKCVKAVHERLNLDSKQAQEYVENVLKIAVIMVGSVFRFPRIDGLSQDVAGLVAGTLQNYPKDAIESLDAFYLLEHDNMPVQAAQPSYGNEQHKHAHAIELVAFEAMENFFKRTSEELQQLRRNNDRRLLTVIIPHYSLPGNLKTDWNSLKIPHEHRIALASRLRFDAMLLLWLRPQFLPDTEKLFESEFLCKMNGASRSYQLRRKTTPEVLKKDVIDPFNALLERERIFLSWLRDISLTGRDWERGQDPDDTISADLFPVKEIEKLLADDPCSEIMRYAGIRNYMREYDLDRLSKCAGTNPYGSGRTPDYIRSRITFRKNGTPVPFIEIMEQLYDLCADTGR